MKTKIILSFILLSISLTGFCTTWTITNSGTTFTPATVTIILGDNVIFSLESIHNAVEVSQATWNANGNTPLSGGFQTSFGGGSIQPAQLTTGTHYYVCAPHASIGMKGMIIVQNSSSVITGILLQPDISVYPTLSKGNFQYTISGSLSAKNSKLEIYNVQGERIFQSPITALNSEIDISNQAKGIYFIKIYSEHSMLTKKIIIQ